MYKSYIKDDIAEQQFQKYYGKDFKLKIDMQYQGMYKNTPIDIIFTSESIIRVDNATLGCRWSPVVTDVRRIC